jgi:hypothetical protein
LFDVTEWQLNSHVMLTAKGNLFVLVVFYICETAKRASTSYQDTSTCLHLQHFFFVEKDLQQTSIAWKKNKASGKQPSLMMGRKREMLVTRKLNS